MMIVLYANMCVVIPLLRARVVKILLITTQTNSCLYKKIIEYIHKNLKDIKYFSTVQGIHKLMSRNFGWFCFFLSLVWISCNANPILKLGIASDSYINLRIFQNFQLITITSCIVCYKKIMLVECYS